MIGAVAAGLAQYQPAMPREHRPKAVSNGCCLRVSVGAEESQGGAPRRAGAQNGIWGPSQNQSSATLISRTGPRHSLSLGQCCPTALTLCPLASYIRDAALTPTLAGAPRVTEQQRDSEDTEFTRWPLQAIGLERAYTIEACAWTVREVVDRTTSTHVLIFASAGTARRVRNFPSNWRELPAEDLHALSWSR
jgi:hypothetical protein